MKSKDYRRHQVKRLKEKALRIARDFWHMKDYALDWSNKNFNHIKACSCYMCCNPRKREDITLQEKRDELKFKEDKDEAL